MPVFTPLPAPLLLRELGLLAVVAGIVALAHPLPAATGILIVVWADERARGSRLLFLIACLGLGLGLGWNARSLSLPDTVPSWIAEPVRVQGLVREIRDLPDGRRRVILDQVRPACSLSPALPGRLAWTWDSPTAVPLPGQSLTATLRIRPVRGFANAQGSDFTAYWLRQGVAWTSWARGNTPDVVLTGQPRPDSVWRQALRDRFNRLLWPSDSQGRPAPAFGPGTALLPALLFADQTALSLYDLERVTRAGLRHSLALSGQHLAVVGLLALVPALLLLRLRPGVLLLLPRRALIGLCSLPLAGLCLWLGNAPPSLIRAALMLVISVFLFRRGVSATLFDGLCLALACMVAADPDCLFELGVQLSFLAVAGMAMAGPLLARLIRLVGRLPEWLPTPFTGWWLRPGQWLTRWLIWGLGLSGAAWLATLPLTALTFGFAPSGLLYNLLWLPVLGLVVLPAAWSGLLLLVFGWEGAAGAVLHLAALPGTWLLDGLQALDRMGMLDPALSLRPHWTAVLGYAALLASLVALAGSAGASRTARRLATAGVLLSLTAVGLRVWSPTDVRLQIVDVGQGQAVIVEWPGGRALIDSGGFASPRMDSGRDILAPILTANHPPRLHAVFASHMDRDHVGGLPFLLNHFAVGTLRTGPLPPVEEGTTTSGTASDISSLERRLRSHAPATMVSGERLDLAPGLWLEALWPPAGHRLHGNDSLVLRVVYNGQGLALLPGDIEPREQRALVYLHDPSSLRAAVLVLPHHGSRRNLEPLLYTAVRPTLAVASAGAYNPWNFPSKEVRAALLARSIPLFTTAEDGGLTIQVLDSGTIALHPQRGKTVTLGP